MEIYIHTAVLLVLSVGFSKAKPETCYKCDNCTTLDHDNPNYQFGDCDLFESYCKIKFDFTKNEISRNCHNSLGEVPVNDCKASHCDVYCEEDNCNNDTELKKLCDLNDIQLKNVHFCQPEPTDPPDTDGLSLGVIIGIVVGGIVLVALIVVAVVVLQKKKYISIRQ